MEPNIFTHVDLKEMRHYQDWYRYLRKSKLRVLMVIDSGVTSINTVYEYMQGKTLGCTQISVKRAVYGYGGGNVVINDAPGEDDPHYDNFKFTSKKANGQLILNDFDVMFIFAVSSGGTLPADQLATLHEWMNAGHGVFATGDHSTLGERLASKIPRVGTMRKWTVADGVPPGGGVDRIDTNQPDPTNASQMAGVGEVPNSAQSDAYPQPIKALPFKKLRTGPFTQLHYPHEILCHPKYGTINVMPDHPHEGECEKPASINLNASVGFATTVANTDEYPEVGGNRERPRIIATGKNSHQYNLAKGEVKEYTFDMISVYDGHKANVGRVVVDSTWHHWFDMNIDGIKAAGGKNWAKIGRYYLNLAKYLAPKGLYKNRCTLDVLDAQFDYPFIEEYVYDFGRDTIYDIGRSFNESLIRRWGKCGVLKFVMQNICVVRPWLCKLLEKELIPRIELGPVCLSCPPHELLIDYVLGGIAIQMQEVRESLKMQFAGEQIKRDAIKVEELEELIQKGTETGVEAFLEQLKADIAKTEKAWLSH